jgi:hypothetical protein
MNETSTFLTDLDVLNAAKVYMHECREPSANCFELRSFLSLENLSNTDTKKEQLLRMDNFIRTLLEKRSDSKINANEQHLKDVNKINDGK